MIYHLSPVLLLKDISFLILCICMSVYECVHVSEGACRSQRWQIFQSWSCRCCYNWVLELNLDPLQEPSLCTLNFWYISPAPKFIFPSKIKGS